MREGLCLPCETITRFLTFQSDAGWPLYRGAVPPKPTLSEVKKLLRSSASTVRQDANTPAEDAPEALAGRVYRMPAGLQAKDLIRWRASYEKEERKRKSVRGWMFHRREASSEQSRTPRPWSEALQLYRGGPEAKTAGRVGLSALPKEGDRTAIRVGQ